MSVNRSWQLAAAFDTAFAHRKDGTILDESVFAKHHLYRKLHYCIAREFFGFCKFRDGIIWSQVMTGSCRVDWKKFDAQMHQLAELSMWSGKPEIDLIITHYGIPLLDPVDITNGKMQDFFCQIADKISSQWKGCFSGYVTSVENGYATAMQTDLGNWRYSASEDEPALTWWELFEARMRAAIAMTHVFREQDPYTDRLACEPFFKNTMKFKDQLRSIRTLLGSPDRMAKQYAPSQTDDWNGDKTLLTDIGINFYGNETDDFENPRYPLSWLLQRARKRFPNHRLRIAETGNCQVADCMQISIEQWLEMIDQQVTQANEHGADVRIVTWSPLLTLEDFTEPGKLSAGSLIKWESKDGSKFFDQQTAKFVSQFTSPVTEEPPTKIAGSLFYL
jgi:hypothetical protein